MNAALNLDTDDGLLDVTQPIDSAKGRKNWILPLFFDVETLDLFSAFCVNTMNKYISKAALSNMRTMIQLLDRRMYNNNDSLTTRLEFILFTLEARLDLGLDKNTLIIEHAKRSCPKYMKDIICDEIIPYIDELNLSNYMVKYINTMVYENLLEGYSLVYAQELSTLFEKKESGRYKRISEFSKDFKDLMSKLQTDVRQCEEFLRDDRGFDLTAKNFRNQVKDILSRLKAPTNKWRTGIQCLNKMLNGGFESSRVYLILGLTGVGKSVILLSIANWLRKYNRIKLKDPNKRPAILFISQENGKDETLERLFNITVSGDDIRGYDDDDIIDLLQNHAGLSVNNNEDIDFIFKYFDDKEIGVTDIYNMIDDLEDDGVEVVAVVQDYIDKLRPLHKYNELRHDLAGVATELKQLARARNIPVISAAQLNRVAASVADPATPGNKKDMTKLLGKHNIGESWGMIQNVDGAIIVNKESDDEPDEDKKKTYLAVKLAKFRGRPGKKKLDYFVHPFVEGNGILLVEDIETKVASRVKIDDFKPFKDDKHNKPKKLLQIPMSDTGQEFIGSFIDSIDENYTHKSLQYDEIEKRTKEIDKKIKKLREREKDLIDRRKNELNSGNYELIDDKYIRIRSRNNNDDGLVKIKSRKKNKKKVGIAI